MLPVRETALRASFQAVRIIAASQRKKSESNLHPLQLCLQYLTKTLHKAH